MSGCQRGSASVKYVPTRKWRRFGKSSFRNARSFSKRLNHLFRKRNSYSLLNKPKANSYELINFCEGVRVVPLTVPCPSQAQVWGVRNCFSKSAAEDLQFDLDLDLDQASQASECRMPKEEMRNGNHKFDALGSLKDSGIATSGDSESDDKRADGDKESDETEREGDAKDSPYSSRPKNCAALNGQEERGRLQSFGSSQCYSDSASQSRGCSYSSSPREPSMSDDYTSIESLDSLDTSYWDLPIMDSYDSLNTLSYSPRSRRYSESMVRDPRMTDGPPQMRMLLANRRMSESWAIRTGNLYRSLDRRPNRGNSLRVNNLSRRGSDSIADSIVETTTQALADAAQDKLDCTNDVHENSNRESDKTEAEPQNIDKETDNSSMELINTSRVLDTSIKEPLQNKRITNIKSAEKRDMLHRSRSADTRSLQRPRKNFRRASSLLGRRAAFSDIESSDESECLPSIFNSDEADCPRLRGRSGGKSRTLPSRKSDGVRIKRHAGRLSEGRNEANQTAANNVDSKQGIQGPGGQDSGTGDPDTGNSLEFMPVKNLMFCSGEHGTLDSGMNDMGKVIEAVQLEAEKCENSEKDMMVMFLVGKGNCDV